MPLVDLRCEDCLHEFEVLLRFHEKHDSKCPACQADKVERLISGGIHAFVKDVKTLGQLAEANTKKLGKTITQEKQYTPKTHDPRKWPDKMTVENKPSGVELDYDLIDMTPKQTEKYIMEGVKPPKKGKK